ncbi:MAG: DGQHR domain-containing protein [Alphaproteobacteria bacterium]|nr:DGQHR domain-containing protein [Alphaproteobacteria bacterium]
MTDLKVLKVSQPIGEFYIGAINSDDLLAISTVDVREFEEGRPDSIDGIQRDLSKSRLKELRGYVNLPYATFPTSVILAVDERCVNLSPIEGCNGLYNLEIHAYEGDPDAGEEPIEIENSAFVIDGQHRLAGLENLHADRKPFQVNVSIFVGAAVADQAEIFSRVNLAQTKVNKSLTYDLLSYAKEQSPHKAAHEIVIALNADDGGPFERKIKRLGVRTPGIDTETLAQATVVNGLLRHLPKDQEKERTKSLFGFGGKSEPNESWRDRIFVEFYRREDLASILEVVENFFDAVKEKWPDAWDDSVEGQILNRTTGFNALIRFLKDAYLHILKDEKHPRVVSKSEFSQLLAEVDIRQEDLNREEYLPGSSGSGRLYRELVAACIPEPDDKQGSLI